MDYRSFAAGFTDFIGRKEIHHHAPDGPGEVWPEAERQIECHADSSMHHFVPVFAPGSLVRYEQYFAIPTEEAGDDNHEKQQTRPASSCGH